MSRLQLLYTQGQLDVNQIEQINSGLKKQATAAPQATSTQAAQQAQAIQAGQAAAQGN